MPLYKVIFENGQSLLVNADDEAGARTHVMVPAVRQPYLGRQVPPDANRPTIDLMTPVTAVELVDKFALRTAK